jgi:hypothetical protein
MAEHFRRLIVEALQNILGHTSLAMMTMRYTHFAPQLSTQRGHED